MPSLSYEQSTFLLHPLIRTHPYIQKADVEEETALAEPDFPDDGTYPERDFEGELEMAEAQIARLSHEIQLLRRELRITQDDLAEAQEDLMYITGKASGYLSDMSVLLSQLAVKHGENLYEQEEVNGDDGY